MGIFSGVGSPASVGATSGGSIYGYGGITAGLSFTVALANPQRRKITFHNVGGNNGTDLYIYQTTLQTTGHDVPYDPANDGLPGSFTLPIGGTWVFEGECQKAWGVYCANTDESAIGRITIVDSNTG